GPRGPLLRFGGDAADTGLARRPAHGRPPGDRADLGPELHAARLRPGACAIALDRGQPGRRSDPERPPVQRPRAAHRRVGDAEPDRPRTELLARTGSTAAPAVRAGAPEHEPTLFPRRALAPGTRRIGVPPELRGRP